MSEEAYFGLDDDKKILERVYIDYRQQMYAVAYGVLHNNVDAEDAVYQSFLRIADNIDKLKQFSRQEILPYIVIIVRNASIQIYNHNKRELAILDDIDDGQFDVQAKPADDEFFEKIESQNLAMVLSKLPQMYKDIIYLKFSCDLKAKEIAPILGISADGVWKRLEGAKRLIREALEGDEPDE